MRVRRAKIIRRLFDPVEPDPKPKPKPPEPEHGWHALSLVNDWIRHSDAKAGVTLAFVAALGAMLFELARGAPHAGCLFALTVVAACAFLLSSAVACAFTLTPRVNDRDAIPEAINRLFFGSISKNFNGDRLGFTEVFKTLTADPDELVKDLAHQIHANAKIATTKGNYAKKAIWLALSSGFFVALVAIQVGLAGTESG